MSVNCVATSAHSSDNTNVSTSAIDTTGATLLVLIVAYYGDNFNFIGTGDFSDSAGNTWTQLTRYDGSGGNNGANITIFYVANPTTASSHTISLSKSATYPGIAFAAFDSVDLSTPFDQENGFEASSTGNSTVQPGSITPSADGYLVVTGMQYVAGTGVAVDSSFTVASTNAGVVGQGFGSGIAWKQQSTAAAVNPQWSASGSPDFRGAAIASFKITTGGYTLTADAGSFSLTGQSATLKATRTLPVAAGSFTLTGQAAALKYGHAFTAATGTFTLTGQAAGLSATRTVTAAAGSFTLSGQSATLTATRTMPAAVGTFTLTGQDVGLSATRTVTAAAGSFTLSGQSATLTATRTMPAAVGTFTLTGQDVGLVVPGKLTADAGAFTISGQAATLRVGRMLASAAGSFTFTGQSAGLACTRWITVSAGTFTLTGQAATLTYSGLVFDPLTFYLTSSRDNSIALTSESETTFNLISRRG